LAPRIENISECNRFAELPERGILADLAWSDPENVADWRPTQWGAGYFFGQQQTAQWCHANKVGFIVRSHQPAMQGFQWWFQRDWDPLNSLTKGLLLLVWSAPNYSYQSGNRASIVKCGFGDSEYLTTTQFDPSPNRIAKKHETAGHYFM
jgi:diadenosine tetraphosphatase ApaH/serine/threonine PP2A family protein phosphatase